MAARTKAERNKQEEVRVTGSSKRKSAALPTAVVPGRHNKTARKSTTQPIHTPPNPPPPSNHRSKKEKLLCVCRTPYDETKLELYLHLLCIINSEKGK